MREAQGGGGGIYLTDVAFISTTKGWVVGGNGGIGAVIMATTDGGGTWVRQDVPSTVGGLNAVRFVSSTNGWAVGNDSAYVTGVFVSTADGGATWTAKTAAGTNGLFDVDFVDTLSGWAVGSAPGSQPTDPQKGVILHTADGGTTWPAQTVPAGIETVYSVSFADATHGLAVASGSAGPAILVTSTGGATWAEEAPPSGVDGLYSVAFVRSTTQAWMTGASFDKPAMIKSTDSGTTWSSVTIPSSVQTLASVAMVDPTHGWAVGDTPSGSGIIIATTNGSTWSEQSAPADSAFLTAVAPVSTSTAWAVGAGKCGNGSILGTSNGGTTWTQELDQTPMISDLEGVAAPDANHVFVVGGDSCGSGLVLASSNGGTTWSRQTVPTDIGRLRGVAFTSSLRGWATGHLADFSGGAIITTADGGQTWTSQTVPADVAELESISFVDTSHGWAAGSGSNGAVVLATSDGGSSWNEQTLPATFDSSYSLSGIFFRDSSHGWAVGSRLTPTGSNSGVAIGTVNGGATWLEEVVPAGMQSLAGVNFATVTAGWAVGFGSSNIIATADGGITWAPQPTPSGFYGLNAVAFVNAQTGWAFGYVSNANGSGGPLATTNGGTSWAVQPISADLIGLNGGSFLNPTSGWTSGVANCPDGGFIGVIYHTANGGNSWTQQYEPCAPGSSAPEITGVQPAYGPQPGGTSVTIYGAKFTGATAVKFGTTAASTFQVLSDGSISAVSPAGTGTVDIRVTAPGGTSASVAADAFTYLPAASVLPAMSNGAYGGYVTVAYLKNTGSATAHAFIAYFDPNGSPVGAGDSVTLGVNASATVRQDNGHSFANQQAGSAIIYSDQPLSAFVNEFAPGGTTDATSYTAIRVQSGVGTTLYAPAIANGAYGGYTTGIGLLNLGSSPTDITVTYRDPSGAAIKVQPLSAVPGRAYRALYSGDSGSSTDAKLPNNFAGTATITSTSNQPLAAIVNEVGPNGQFSSYDAVPGGSTTLNAPVMLNGGYGGYYTGMGIQNTSGTQGTVTVKFYDGNGNHVTPDVTASIAANAYLPLYQGAAGQGPPPSETGYTGVLTSTVPIAAIVNEVAPPSSVRGPVTQSTSYNSFPAGTAVVNLALVENAGSDGWTTGLGVMNTGTTTTHVTVTYYDASSGNPLNISQQTDLGPNAFYGPYQGAPALLPPGTRATAVLSTSSGGSIAVVCNEQAANAFMSYDGQ